MTDRDIRDHLKGRETLGLYQLSDDDRVLWLVLDVDVNSELVRQAQLSMVVAVENAKKHAKSLARVLQGYGIPFLCEYSGSKGYHLWVFFDEPVTAGKAQAVGRWVENQVVPPQGIAVEVFPKQSGRQSLGSLVKMPLGFHRKTKNKCEFVGPDFEPLADQWNALRQVALLTEDDLDEIIAEYGLTILESIRVESTGVDYEPRAVLPCFVSLMRKGVSRGMRDVAAFKLGCYLRTRGLPIEMAEAAMTAWNERNDPPMQLGLLNEKLSSSYRGSYSPFPCSEPMFDHLCDVDCKFYPSKLQKRNRS